MPPAPFPMPVKALLLQLKTLAPSSIATAPLNTEPPNVGKSITGEVISV